LRETEEGGKAIASCAKQPFIITKVGHILGFQAFCEEQQCKNCASDKAGHSTTVVKAEADCIAPALTPQKPSAQVV